jgi:hypothetical protein
MKEREIGQGEKKNRTEERWKETKNEITKEIVRYGSKKAGRTERGNAVNENITFKQNTAKTRRAHTHTHTHTHRNMHRPE